MRVEFFGLLRERAGVPEVDVSARTLGEMLRELTEQFPSLADVVDVDRLRPSFIANLNGDRFVTDPRTQLDDGDCVLILSADAGG